MFIKNTKSLTARRMESAETIIRRACDIVAQDIVNGDLSRDDAAKIHVYAIANLLSGIDGDTEKGAADRRRETVREYIFGQVERLEESESEAA